MVTHRFGTVEADLTVEAGFGYSYGDSITWTDITTWVQGITTNRGRRREIDRVTAGHCTIRLRNDDRRFEAGYTGGPYGADVVPMVPVRVTLDYDGDTYPIFYGYADEWVPRFDAAHPRTSFVDLRCTDAFKILALVDAPESVWAATVQGLSPHRWFRMNETAGRLVDSSGNGGHGILQGWDSFETGQATHRWGTDRGALRFDGISQQVFIAGGPATSVPAIEVVFTPDDRGATDSDPVPLVVLSYTVSGLADVMLLAIQWDDTTKRCKTHLLHPLVLYRDQTDGIPAGQPVHLFAPRNGGVYRNGVRVTDLELTIYGSIADNTNTRIARAIGLGGLASGTIEEVVIHSGVSSPTDLWPAWNAPWDKDRTGTRIGRLLDIAGWPSGLEDIDTGQKVLGPATLANRSVLDLLWEVVEFERGNLYVARDGTVTFRGRTALLTDNESVTSQTTYTYGPDNTDVARFSGVTFDSSDELIVNHCIVTATGRAAYEAEDATSISTYGRRTRRLNIPEADANYGQALADWIVYTQKDPQRRVTSLRVPISRDEQTFTETLALELGHRVTVELDPPGTGTISEELIVEGIDHDITPGDRWTTTLWLSPPPQQVAIVGTSLVGDGSIIGY